MLQYLQFWLRGHDQGALVRLRLVGEPIALESLLLMVDEVGIAFRRLNSGLKIVSPWSAVCVVIQVPTDSIA